MFLMMLTASAAAVEMVVTRNGVNFRAEASLQSQVIRALDAGARAQLLEHDPAGWSKVIVDGTTGYIKSEFLAVPAGTGPVTFKTTDTVNFRSGPSTGAAVITALDPGASVEVLEHDPAGWSLVRANGTTGYIKSEFLARPVNDSQDTSTSATTRSGTSPVILKTSDAVNFRTGPSTNAGIIRTLSPGAIVGVIEYDPYGWSLVSLNNEIGYIRSDFLRPGNDVELLDWSIVINILRNGEPIQIIDVRTGLSFNLQCFSKGDHADVEPVTLSDTGTIFRTRDGVWSWAARPLWVVINNRVIAASMHGMPHSISTISGNGVDGHFCLHFLGSTTSSTSESYKADLQNAVMEAWNAR